MIKVPLIKKQKNKNKIKRIESSDITYESELKFIQKPKLKPKLKLIEGNHQEKDIQKDKIPENLEIKDGSQKKIEKKEKQIELMEDKKKKGKQETQEKEEEEKTIQSAVAENEAIEEPQSLEIKDGSQNKIENFNILDKKEKQIEIKQDKKQKGKQEIEVEEKEKTIQSVDAENEAINDEVKENMEHKDEIINYLKTKHYCERDNRIKKVPPHNYIIDNKKEYLSVTGLIDEFFPTFDDNAKLESLEKEGVFSDPRNKKYFGTTKQLLKNKWMENGINARNAGTKLHEQIETFYNEYAKNDYCTIVSGDGINTEDIDLFQLHFNFDDDPDNKEKIESQQFRDFHEQLVEFLDKEMGFKIYRTEWQLFMEEYEVAGTLDALFETNENKKVLVDWKRIHKDMHNKPHAPWEKITGKTPLDKIPNLKYHIFACKLSVYRYILETRYHMIFHHPKTNFLALFHPHASRFQIHPLPYYKEEIIKVLNLRLHSLVKE